MRAKVAKRLRREARAATVGLPEKDYAPDQRTLRRKKNRQGDEYTTGTIVLSNCTRATYKKLKKEYKA